MNIWSIALSALLASASTAKAGDWSVMGGAAFFQPPQSGIYWNDNQPHDNFVTPAAWAIRFDTAPVWGAWNAAVQYTNFGTVKINSLAVTADAPQQGGYDPNTGGCVGPCAPLARWKMESEVQSIAFMGVRRFNRWTLEAGLNVYEVKTRGDVLYKNGSSYTYPSARFLDVGPMAGVGYQSGPWSVHAQLWRMEAKGDTPGAFNEKYQWTLMAGYSF